MTKDEALKMAIDYLGGSYEAHKVRKACQEALEQPAQYDLIQGEPLDADDDGLYYVPKQPAQKPVAWISVNNRLPNNDGKYIVYGNCTNDGYQYDMAIFSEGKFRKYNQPTHWMLLPSKPNKTNTHPAPSWQGLSDDEIIEKCAPIWGAIINTRDREETVDFARAIERALKEKNG